MTDLYLGSGYAESNPTWHAEDAPWKARQVAAILRDNDVAFSTLAEIGCGTGETLVQLAATFPGTSYTGYDIAPEAIRVAGKRSHPRVAFHLADPLPDPLDAPREQFDVVLVADVVEHVEDCFRFVRQVKQFGGKKVFHVPLALSMQSIARMWPILDLRRKVGHIHYFTKDTALALLTDCGYTILDHRYTASRLELPNQALSSRLMATPRRLLSRIDPDLAVRVLGGYSLLVLGE